MELDIRYWCCDCNSNYIKSVERRTCNDCCAVNDGNRAPTKKVVEHFRNLHGWEIEE